MIISTFFSNMKLNYDWKTAAIIFVLFCGISSYADCTCLLPSTFTGTWWDSRTNGAITVSSLQVTTGWELPLNTGKFSTYTCIRNDASHWVFRSDQVVNFTYGLNYYAVFCLQFTRVTDNSYYYYLISDKEPIMNDTRVLLVDTATENAYTMLSHYCNPQNDGPPDGRVYNVLVKANTQSSIHLNNLPDPLLGVFYNMNNGSTNICGAGSVWDGCYYNAVIDRTTVKFNNTQCATLVMGSTNGLLYHVASIYYSSTYYTILINADGTDTKFTCIAITQSGSSRSVSTNPGGCAEAQVSTNRTSNSKSLFFTMTAYETCLLTTTTSTTSTTSTSTTTRPTTTTARVSTTPNTGASSTTQDSNTTAAVVGAVLSILLLILIIIIAYLLYKKYKGTALITHKASVREQPPIDIKKPLPDNDFELSDHPLASSLSVENDMVIEPMTPTDKNDNPMKDLTSYSNPVQQPRPPVSSMWHKPSVPFHDEVKRNLTPLPTKPKLQSKVWHASHPLPPISGHL